MPQVASDTSSVVASFSPPSPPRPAPADDAPATPFESMLDDTAPIAADQPPPEPPRSAKGDNQPDAGEAAANGSPSTTTKTKSEQTARKADKAAKPDKNANAKPADKPQTCQVITTAAKVIATKVPGEADGADTEKTSHCKSSDAKPADATVANAAAVCPAPANLPAAANILVAAITPANDTTAPQAPAAKNASVAAAVAVAVVNLPNLPALKPSAANNVLKTQAPEKSADAPKSAIKAPDAGPSAPTQSDANSDAKPLTTDGNADKSAAVRPHDTLPEHRTDPADIIAGTTNAETAVAKATDAAQAVTATAPNSQPAAAQSAAPSQAQAAAVPLAGVAIEIASKGLAGKNRFEIRLDPPELGRIDVRLDVDKNGQVTSHLTVDRADTLDLLRRDSSGLERALQDAGLKTSDNGLQFSLRDQSTGQQQNNSPIPGSTQIVVEDDALSAAAAPRSYARYAGMGSGIDIRV